GGGRARAGARDGGRVSPPAAVWLGLRAGGRARPRAVRVCYGSSLGFQAARAPTAWRQGGRGPRSFLEPRWRSRCAWLPPRPGRGMAPPSGRAGALGAGGEQCPPKDLAGDVAAVDDGAGALLPDLVHRAVERLGQFAR